MVWDIGTDDVWIEPQVGIAQHIRHIQQPFPEADPAQADALQRAADYLTAVRGRLGLEQTQIQWLIDTIDSVDSSGDGPPSNGGGHQLRWKQLVNLRDETAVVIIQQTQEARFGPGPATGQVDVFGSGIRIVMHRHAASGHWQVTSLNSTQRQDIDLSESEKLLDDPGGILTALDFHPGVESQRLHVLLVHTLARFGLPPVDPALGILDVRQWIFQFNPRLRTEPTGTNDTSPKPGFDYLAFGFRVVYPGGAFTADRERASVQDLPGFDLVVRFPDGAPLAQLALVADVVPDPIGQIFPIDPPSRTGDVTIARPASRSSVLNPYQVSVPLRRLAPPQGLPPRWHLTGEHVYLFDPITNPGPHGGSLGVPPPTKLVSETFNADARSNDFAAVNAYHHIDRMFQMIADFGLPFVGNPTGLAAPAEVVHRASIQPGPCGDGRCINAQFRIIGPPPGSPTAQSVPQFVSPWPTCTSTPAYPKARSCP